MAGKYIVSRGKEAPGRWAHSSRPEHPLKLLGRCSLNMHRQKASSIPAPQGELSQLINSVCTGTYVHTHSAPFFIHTLAGCYICYGPTARGLLFPHHTNQDPHAPNTAWFATISTSSPTNTRVQRSCLFPSILMRSLPALHWYRYRYPLSTGRA